MTEFALLRPDQDELADAQEALEDILHLDESGEIDLPPYLIRLLLQLQELLVEFGPGVENLVAEPVEVGLE